jgi:polysaccharide biosynthesis protein PslH
VPPRALIVCPEPPYPLHGGGAFRTAALLQYLARNYDLDAVFFSEETRPDPRLAIPPGLVRESLLVRLPIHPRNWSSRAWRNAGRYLRGVPPLVDRFAGSGAASELTAWLGSRRYEVAVVEHLWCAPFAQLIRPHAARLVIDLHNVESEWHDRMAALEPWPASHAHRRFAAAARRMESRLLNEFDTVMVTSEREHRLPGLGTAAVYPNTIPAVESTPPAFGRRDQIVFSGNLEYPPNIGAVKWFGEEIWPLVQRRHPGIEWVVVGRRPESVRHVLPQGRVRTTGEVSDALREIGASMAAIVPVRSGSGTRIKILEAWAAGTPVVSTSLGAEGLPGDALALADTAEGFAARVSDLLSNQAERQRLAEAGSAVFNKQFTWEAGWKVLARLGM